MKHTTMIAALITATALSACGSSDDGGSDATGPQAAAADAAIASAAEDGVDLDRECVEEVAAQLSDADAELIAADNTDDLSAEGDALGVELGLCADADQLIDLFITGMGDSVEQFDEDCLREQLTEVDLGGLIAASGADEGPPPELTDALMPCFQG